MEGGGNREYIVSTTIDFEKVRAFIQKIEAFMVNDIQAAIEGKANFLAALGLLDYTEILGGIVSGNLIKPPEGWSKEDNFKVFLPYLDTTYQSSNKQPYQDLNNHLKKLNKSIYGKVRSGLVHQYLLSQTGEIRMTERRGDDCGIMIDSHGSITFVVQRYFCDFRAGLAKYKEDLLHKQVQKLLEVICKIPMDKI